MRRQNIPFYRSKRKSRNVKSTGRRVPGALITTILSLCIALFTVGVQFIDVFMEYFKPKYSDIHSSYLRYGHDGISFVVSNLGNVEGLFSTVTVHLSETKGEKKERIVFPPKNLLIKAGEQKVISWDYTEVLKFLLPKYFSNSNIIPGKEFVFRQAVTDLFGFDGKTIESISVKIANYGRDPVEIIIYQTETDETFDGMSLEKLYYLFVNESWSLTD